MDLSLLIVSPASRLALDMPHAALDGATSFIDRLGPGTTHFENLGAMHQTVAGEHAELRVRVTPGGERGCPLAHAIKNRIERGRYRLCHVFVDIDSCVYAVMKPGAWLEWTLATHPELLVGVYTKGVDAGNLAADFDDLRRAA